jgi:hypothetical protein
MNCDGRRDVKIIPTQLPEPVLKQAQELAERENVPLEQIITLAVAQSVGALKKGLRLHVRRANQFLIERRGAFDLKFCQSGNGFSKIEIIFAQGRRSTNSAASTASGAWTWRRTAMWA